MNYKGTLFYLGVYSLFVTIISFVNILYSIYFNSYLDINAYIVSMVVSLGLGLTFYFIGKKEAKNISLSDQVLLILLTFIFIPFLISIPFFLSENNISFLDSYFESISGFTATGFTAINHLDELDEPMLLWRSTSQWLGGLIFLISIIGTLGSKKIKFKPIYFFLDSYNGGNFFNNFFSNFIKILIIYSVSTLIIIFLYTLVDLRFFDSFNLAFTTISGGGFLPKNELSSIINSDLKILILSFTLLIPILNFYLFYKIITNQFKFSDHFEDFHLIVIIFLTILLMYFLIIPNEGFLNIFLMIVSCISTSGISLHSSELDLSILLIILTIVGGSAISTSSGIKYVRLYILAKLSYQEIYKLVKPINVLNRNLFNTSIKISDEDFKISFFIFIFFISGAFLLTGILTLDYVNFEDAFKISLLTLTNTVSSGMFGIANFNFNDLQIISKSSLIIFMILGKIEIIAIFLLIKKIFFRE